MALVIAASRIVDVTDETLDVLVGKPTVSRGLQYAAHGRVRKVASLIGGRSVAGEVAGSQGRTYQTVVTLEPHRRGFTWRSHCSCPMEVDCKHTVALVATARDAARSAVHTGYAAPPLFEPAARPAAAPAALRSPSVPRQSPPSVLPAPLRPRPGLRQQPPGPRQVVAPPVVPRWERALELVLREETPVTGLRPLGLLVEPQRVTAIRPRWSPPADQAVPRIRLRPVIPGAREGWIRTGVSWNDFDGADYRSGHLRRMFAMEQVEALVELHHLASARMSTSYYSRAPEYVHLDTLGRRWFALLDGLVAAGVRLMADAKRESPVILASEPVRLVAEVAHDDDGGGSLESVLDLPAEFDDADQLDQIGAPATGLFSVVGDRLVLAPLAVPLDGPLTTLLDQGRIDIPPQDWERFLAGHVPALRRRIDVRGVGGFTLPEPPVPRLAVTATFEPGHHVVVDVAFVYRGSEGDPGVVVPLGPPQGGAVLPIRDRVAEDALLERTSSLLDVADLWTVVGGSPRLVPGQRLSGFATVRFAELLPGLTADPDVVLTVVGEPAAYEQTVEAPVIHVSATESTDPEVGTDWFDLGVRVSVAGQEVPLGSLIGALARGAERLLLDSGTWFELARPELVALASVLAEARALQDRPGDSLRLTYVQAGLWEELVALGVVEEQSSRWSRTVGALLEVADRPDPEPPVGLAATLRPYQLEGFHWLSLLWDCGIGGILADDMGLGKTLQTLAMAVRAAEAGQLDDAPLLVVAPTSVVGTWVSEAARFAPGLRTVSLTETRARAGVPLADAVGDAQLVVTSYALLRIDEEVFRGRAWAGLVLDEAQFVKNHQAKTYQAVRRVPAPVKIAITGTPLENSLMDLWALLSIVAPGLYPRPQHFRESYQKPIESGRTPELLATLRRRIRPLMLRRTKEQVLAELPPKQEQVLPVPLAARHRAVYDRHLQRERQRILGLVEDLDSNRIAVLRALTVLRQLALDPGLVDPTYAGLATSAKIDTLVDQLRELASEGHRALVFSQFTGFLRLVRERLTAEGIEYVYLDGRTRDRAARVAAFRDGDAPAFLISLKAGGFGLTLTEADYVFVLDPWWNPAAETQAIDRTHRIGQTRPVNVYRLVSTDTVEEKVVALQARKRELFARVVDDGAMLSSTLNADDIRGLLGS